MEAVEALCDIRKSLRLIAASYPPESATATALTAEAEKLDKMTVLASITIEALNPVFDTDNARDGYLTVADLAYNAFMIGRNMENRENGGRSDWFNDTWPLMKAGVERIQKECLKRMEYAAQHQPKATRSPLEIAVRNIIFNVEQTPENHYVQEIVTSLRSALGLKAGERP